MDNTNPAQFYRLFCPAQAAGTSVIYFDLWNPTGSGVELRVWSVIPIVSGAVAVTGVIGIDLFLNRTTAIGTSGTAATRGGTSFTAATISPMGGNASGLGPSVTARLTPSGGATAGAVISQCSIFTEETNAATYLPCNDFVRRNYPDYPPVVVPVNQGISVVQNAVASVGNIAFDVIFQVVDRT